MNDSQLYSAAGPLSLALALALLLAAIVPFRLEAAPLASHVVKII